MDEINSEQIKLITLIKEYVEDETVRQLINKRIQINIMKPDDKKKLKKLMKDVNSPKVTDDLLKLEKKYSTWYVISHSLAKHYLSLKDYSKAKQYFDKTCSENSYDYDIHLESVKFMMKFTPGNDYETVVRCLRCLKLSRATEPYMLILNILIKYKDILPYLIQLIDLGLSVFSDDVELINYKAVIYEKLGDLESSLICHQKCLEINKYDYRILYNIGLIMSQLPDRERSDGCISYLTKCIERNQNFDNAYVTLAQYYNKIHDSNEAVNTCTLGLQITEKQQFYMERAVANLKLENLDEAKEDLDKITMTIAGSFSVLGRTKLLLAELYTRLGEYDIAESYYYELTNSRQVYLKEPNDVERFDKSYENYKIKKAGK